jgi:hypothetical protein
VVVEGDSIALPAMSLAVVMVAAKEVNGGLS